MIDYIRKWLGRKSESCHRNSLDTPLHEHKIDHITCFFVCGYMRSGTNWANNLLNLHPNVACHGEYMLNQLRTSFDEWLQQEWSVPRLAGVDDRVVEHFEKLLKRIMYECVITQPRFSNRDILWLGDRSPRLLAPIVIHGSRHFRMLRDGRDVLVSWTYLNFARNQLSVFEDHPEMVLKQQQFAKNNEYFLKHPHELLDDETWVTKVSRQWDRRVKEDDNVIARIEEGSVDAKVMSIRYEDLHANTESVRNQMYEFLDLSPSLAAPLDSSHEKTSPGLEQEQPAGLYRKGVVGEWQSYFTHSTESAFVSNASETLDANGYTDRLT